MTNGEKYKTAHERAKVFKFYCCGKSAVTNETCNLNADCDECRFAWLDLEMEEEKEKPLPCLFCDGLVCDRCEYITPFHKTIAEVTAAHNSVAKAINEVK